MEQKTSRFGELKLIVTNSHPDLGKKVANELGVIPLEFQSELFPNHEQKIRRLGDISGANVCILSSLHSYYDTIKELRLICSTLAGAARVFGVFPFVSDGKSDHQKKFGEPVNYKDTAMEISSAGFDTIAIFDQHTPQHPYYYDTIHYRLNTVHHVYLMRILIEFAQSQPNDYDVVLAPDAGGFKRNASIASLLKKDIAFILKYRDPESREVDIKKSQIIGDIAGKKIFVFEDMIQEGGTVVTAAKIAKYHGAKEVTFLAVHNDFSLNTIKRINPFLEDGTIDKIFILETVPLQNREHWHENLVVLSPAKMIADVIHRIHYEEHMRSLFLEM